MAARPVVDDVFRGKPPTLRSVQADGENT
jgi:hypothetical protein